MYKMLCRILPLSNATSDNKYEYLVIRLYYNCDTVLVPYGVIGSERVQLFAKHIATNRLLIFWMTISLRPMSFSRWDKQN